MVAIWSFCSGEGVKLENSLSDHLSNISHIATEISSKIIVSHCSCFILVVLVWLAVKLNPSHPTPHPKQITSTFVDILVSSAVDWTETCWPPLEWLLVDDKPSISKLNESQWLCLILKLDYSLADQFSNMSYIPTEISSDHTNSVSFLLFLCDWQWNWNHLTHLLTENRLPLHLSIFLSDQGWNELQLADNDFVSSCLSMAVKIVFQITSQTNPISQLRSAMKLIVSHCSCFILVVLVWLVVTLNPSYTPPHPKQITCTFVDILVWSAVKWTATCWQLLSLILSDDGCSID
jgi:hypothetical protein